MKSSKDFKEEAAKLLKLVEANERGEISDIVLLVAWKKFMRSGMEYFRLLDNQNKLN